MMKSRILSALDCSSHDLFYVVDVSSFIFRAYFSTGYLSTSSGTPVGAVLGVANMLLSLLAEHQPGLVAIAMDSKAPTFRKELYSEYKANRPPPPDDLVVQFPLVDELVSALGLLVLQKDGFEADDLIATAKKVATRAGKRTVVVSGDKDLLQLVGPDAVMLDTMKKKVWGSSQVLEKWGVNPQLLGDLLALAGDSSDNIPGVPRVGPKTAAPLLNQFGGLEALYAGLGEVKSKAMAKRLGEHEEAARLSRKLVALNSEVPVSFELGQAAYDGTFSETLALFLERLEFHQLLGRLFPGRVSTDGGGQAAAEQSAPEVVYETVDTIDRLEEIGQEIRTAGRFAIDLETTSVDAVVAEIVGVALSVHPFNGAYVPVAHKAGSCISLDACLRVISPLLLDPDIGVVIQNVKYEDTIFRRHGVVMKNVVMDPMLASYLLGADVRSHGLDALAKRVLGRTMVSYEEVTRKSRGSQLLFDDVAVDEATAYAAEDAEVTLALVEPMSEAIDTADAGRLLHDVEIPVARVLAGMELRGVLVDVDRLTKMSEKFALEIGELEKRAHDLAGRSFNLASPKQLQQLLFNELGLPVQKKTKTGYSTDQEVLETLKFLHPLPEVLLEHRVISKLKNTYLDALPRLVNGATGRIHTQFNQTVAATGRFSSSNPNLQNIPIRSERGRDIRRAFVAPPGYKMLSADYSQVELRVLAHLSEDAALMEAYHQGDDIHERTARAAFGLPPGEPVSGEQRSMAKTVNFGVIYGKTAFSLSKELGISRPRAQEFIDAYFGLYQGVARYMEQVEQTVRNEKAAYTLLGRKRSFPEIDSRNYSVRQHAERMARNMPIQGTAADLLKIAMINVDKAIACAGLDLRMLLTVHDELVFEVAEHQVDDATALVKREMEGAMELKVPLLVEVGLGDSWADAH